MTIAELVKSKVEQIASELRATGYSVVVQPGPSDLPPFLREFEPDVIATSDRENVVVEVRSPAELESEEFVRLAETIEAHPGWRLQLSVVDLPTPQEIPARAELAGTQQVHHSLEQAQVLVRERHYEAAAMVAWSAVETILRRHALATGVDADRKGSLYVLKHLYAAGALDADQYETLDRMLQFRDAFVHGFAARVDPETVQRLIDEAEHLRSLSAA